MDENVIKFPSKQPLFNQDLRQKLETGMQGYTEKPVEAVNTAEQIICTWIVAVARRFAENLGRKIGEKIVNKVTSNG